MKKLCMRFSMSLLPLLSLSLVSRHSIVFFFFTKSQSNKSASQRKEPENSHQRKSNFHFCAVPFKNGWTKWDKSDSQINVMCSRYFPQILPIHSSVLSNGKKNYVDALDSLTILYLRIIIIGRQTHRDSNTIMQCYTLVL